MSSPTSSNSSLLPPPIRKGRMYRALDAQALESLAVAVRRIARLEPDEIVPSASIVDRVLGHGGLQIVRSLSTPAVLARVADQWRIYLSGRAIDTNFVVAHELGHWILDREGVPRGRETEVQASYIGAAIIASPQAMRRAYFYYGERYAQLAKAFGATQSLVALRIAEVLGADRALVSTVVRVKGAFAWPDAEVVREWATAPPAGVARVPLRGAYDRGRVVLKVR